MDLVFRYIIFGVQNFFMQPATVMIVLSLGLYLGQQETKSRYQGILAFWLTMMIALVTLYFVVELKFRDLTLFQLFILGQCMMMGLIVAWSPITKPLLILSLSVASAAIIAISTSSYINANPPVSWLAGYLFAMLGLMLASFLLASFFKMRHWQRIAIRVLGSWISASAILIFAFVLKLRTFIP